MLDDISETPRWSSLRLHRYPQGSRSFFVTAVEPEVSADLCPLPLCKTPVLLASEMGYSTVCRSTVHGDHGDVPMSESDMYTSNAIFLLSKGIAGRFVVHFMGESVSARPIRFDVKDLCLLIGIPLAAGATGGLLCDFRSLEACCLTEFPGSGTSPQLHHSETAVGLESRSQVPAL